MFGTINLPPQPPHTFEYSLEWDVPEYIIKFYDKTGTLLYESEDLPFIPNMNENVVINGKEYYVEKITHDIDKYRNEDVQVINVYLQLDLRLN